MITVPSPDNIQLAGAWTRDEPGWTDRRVGTWLRIFLALGIALGVEWLRTADRTGSLWALAALGPPAVGISYPAIFVAASVGLVLAIPVLETRSPRTIAPFALFGMATVATFLVLLRWVAAPQGASV